MSIARLNDTVWYWRQTIYRSAKLWL